MVGIMNNEFPSEEYLKKAKEILDNFNIKVKSISTKEEIIKSKSFEAILKPKLEKVKIK